MIIQIIGNDKNLQEDLPFYHNMLDIIHDDGAVIARDWISAAQNRVDKGVVRDATKIVWDDVHKENSEAISRSDIVIIEATNYGFQEGFYTSQALQRKKPVLLITRENPRSLLVAGINNQLLTVQHYESSDELKKIVHKFIRSNTISSKDLRFNFLIDRQIYSYLRRTSYETGKNKSEIIRELLEGEIEQEKSER